MDAIYILIPLTLILLAVAVAIFFWAVNSDQYSDLDKEASRILFEEKATDRDISQGEPQATEQPAKDNDSHDH